MTGCHHMVVGLLATSTASTVAQLCAGWVAVLPIAALAIYGWFHGIFLAVIAGMQVLASFLMAMGWARPLAANLETFGCPTEHSLAAAFILIFMGCIVAIRLAVGAAVSHGAVRFTPLIDGIGGVCLGAVAGALLGGSLLVGWSLSSPPAWVRFDADQLPFDGGRQMLWSFARWATPDVHAGRIMFDGEPLAVGNESGVVVRASEPFVDANGNNVCDVASDTSSPDAAERFLDLDSDGAFTPDTRCVDRNGDGRRAIGLSDCYRLAEWRRVRCQHAPQITSSEAGEISEGGAVEEPVYHATATDVDPGAVVTFSVKPVDGEDGIDIAVDPATGMVTLLEPADFEKRKRHIFVVVATDQTGLADEKLVTIRVRDVALQ